jgi:hypothetical protein
MGGSVENGDCNLENYRKSGNRRHGIGSRLGARVLSDMKNFKRFLFGVLSSLLFATGFVRAASQLDPMSRSLDQTATDSVISGAPDCSSPCDVVDDNL